MADSAIAEVSVSEGLGPETPRIAATKKQWAQPKAVPLQLRLALLGEGGGNSRDSYHL